MPAFEFWHVVCCSAAFAVRAASVLVDGVCGCVQLFAGVSSLSLLLVFVIAAIGVVVCVLIVAVFVARRALPFLALPYDSASSCDLFLSTSNCHPKI